LEFCSQSGFWEQKLPFQVSIQISPSKPKKKGHLSVTLWLTQLAEQQAQPRSVAHLQKTDPEAWLRKFRAWATAHDRTTMPLSDDALRRESIYPDRV
jgi:hypothetical protein